ncbi:MAG: HPP family protein [Pseudolabrys sp.]
MISDKRVWLAVIGGACGAMLAVWAMEAFAAHVAVPLMTVPFGTSIVLVMGNPEVEPAQPRALVGGHIVSALVGLMVVKAVGPGAFAAAAAVGFAMIAMHFTRTFHPPAGINPLLVVVADMPWTFLLVPVAAGAVALALFAWVWHALVRRYPWPHRWW